MKLNRNRTRHYPLFIILTACVTLIPLGSPLVPTAGAINRHNEFNRNTNINASRNVINASGKGGTAAWKHDSSHRKGVNYSSSNVAQKYGASSGSSRVTRDQARGYSAANASNRAGAGAQAGNRAAASSRPSPSAANRTAC